MCSHKREESDEEEYVSYEDEDYYQQELSSEPTYVTSGKQQKDMKLLMAIKDIDPEVKEECMIALQGIHRDYGEEQLCALIISVYFKQGNYNVDIPSLMEKMGIEQKRKGVTKYLSGISGTNTLIELCGYKHVNVTVVSPSVYIPRLVGYVYTSFKISLPQDNIIEFVDYMIDNHPCLLQAYPQIMAAALLQFYLKTYLPQVNISRNQILSGLANIAKKMPTRDYENYYSQITRLMSSVNNSPSSTLSSSSLSSGISSV